METALFQSDDPVTRTKLYLRILYGKDYLVHARALCATPAELPELTRRLLDSIDFDVMEIEQTARSRNLGRHILRAAPALQLGLSPQLFVGLVAEYTNSDAFWITAGRTLAENFCFFVHQEVGDQLTKFQKDTAKACGIVAGVSAAAETQSPWVAAGQALKLEQGDDFVHCETFISDFRLVDEFGELATKANLQAVRTKACSRIFIRRLADQRVVVHSVAL